MIDTDSFFSRCDKCGCATHLSQRVDEEGKPKYQAFCPHCPNKMTGWEDSPGAVQRACGKINNTEAAVVGHKYDQGKVRMALVPAGIIEAVGVIRTYGTEKYGDPDGWKTVDAWRYRDALMRHLVEYLRDPSSVDQESGHSHLFHMACNIAFLIEMEANP
jgi:hypothetical protein